MRLSLSASCTSVSKMTSNDDVLTVLECFVRWVDSEFKEPYTIIQEKYRLLKREARHVKMSFREMALYHAWIWTGWNNRVMTEAEREVRNRRAKELSARAAALDCLIAKTRAVLADYKEIEQAKQCIALIHDSLLAASDVKHRTKKTRFS